MIHTDSSLPLDGPSVPFSQLPPEVQAALLQQLAWAAAERWPLQCVRLEPIKVRENAVYAIHTADNRRAVLRVHRLGYHSDASLRSELSWMRALEAAGMEVPKPIPSRAGNTFERVSCPELPEARQVDVFEWIPGRQLGSVDAGLASDETEISSIYTLVGELAARMHNASGTWTAPADFTRHSWCEAGLAGESPLWGRFWELEALSASQRRLLERLREEVSRELLAFGKSPDRFGLIHGDLVPENILIDAERLRIIDFDDAGFGWHMFIRREPYYETARDALLAGYRRHRPLPNEHARLLPLFLAARGTTYLGWVHTRKGERVATELTPQLIELAVAAANDYLDSVT
jgi:Ser/Thr protein kinase RdoA (MazF antagonist)